MKNKQFYIFLFLINCYTFSQNVEKLTIIKNKIELHKGYSENIKNWYIYKENNNMYLAELYMDNDSALKWFEKRKDSQNIFKYEGGFNLNDTITFKKDNEIETLISFKCISVINSKIELINISKSDIYIFEKKYSIEQ